MTLQENLSSGGKTEKREKKGRKEGRKGGGGGRRARQTSRAAPLTWGTRRTRRAPQGAQPPGTACTAQPPAAPPVRLRLPHISHLQLLRSAGGAGGAARRNSDGRNEDRVQTCTHTQRGSASPAHGAAQPPPAKTTALPSAGTAARGSSLLGAENPPASHPAAIRGHCLHLQLLNLLAVPSSTKHLCYGHHRGNRPTPHPTAAHTGMGQGSVGHVEPTFPDSEAPTAPGWNELGCPGTSSVLCHFSASLPQLWLHHGPRDNGTH